MTQVVMNHKNEPITLTPRGPHEPITLTPRGPHAMRGKRCYNSTRNPNDVTRVCYNFTRNPNPTPKSRVC